MGKGAWVGGVVLLAVLGSCMGDDTTTDDGYGESVFLDDCEQWNVDNPDLAGDPEQCAEDAEQLEEDMIEYMENNP